LDNTSDFVEALAHFVAKRILPTTFTSQEMRAVDASIRRQSFWSAQNNLAEILADEKGKILSILQPKQEAREGLEHTVTVGFNPAYARQAIKEHFRAIHYDPGEDLRGTIQDLSGDKRINLVVDTNVKLAHGAGHFVQGNLDPNVVDLWPAWEFIRAVHRKEPRDWEGPNGLWLNACRRAGDDSAIRVYAKTGRMCALKSSGVWIEISDPDYTPGGIGEPYDPAAFGTGMVREEMSREETEDVGLLEPGQPAKPAAFDLASLFKAAA
jgi:hypothetical protein